MVLIFGGSGRTFLTKRVCSKRCQEGTAMFELIVFGILLVVLLGALGLPYPQSTYNRWNRR